MFVGDKYLFLHCTNWLFTKKIIQCDFLNYCFFILFLLVEVYLWWTWQTSLHLSGGQLAGSVTDKYCCKRMLKNGRLVIVLLKFWCPNPKYSYKCLCRRINIIEHQQWFYFTNKKAIKWTLHEQQKDKNTRSKLLAVTPHQGLWLMCASSPVTESWGFLLCCSVLQDRVPV